MNDNSKLDVRNVWNVGYIILENLNSDVFNDLIEINSFI